MFFLCVKVNFAQHSPDEEYLTSLGTNSQPHPGVEILTTNIETWPDVTPPLKILGGEMDQKLNDPCQDPNGMLSITYCHCPIPKQ